MPSPSVEIDVGERTVRISNPDRVYFPARGETKLDLAKYYLAVGDGIVRALRERPCMLHRYPDGVGGREDLPEAAAQGRARLGRDRRGAVPRPAGTPTSCASPSSPAWSGRCRCRPSSSTPGTRAAPTPSTRTSCASTSTRSRAPGSREAKQVAEVVHEVLDELGAVGWPKTSGSKGMHVYVRIEPRFGFREVRRAALAFAREVERRAPAPVTTAVVEGGARRRRSSSTTTRTPATAPSPRPTPCAASRTARCRRRSPGTSCPTSRRRDFTIATMPARFAELGDLHAGIDDAVWSIEPLLEWAERDEHDHGLGDCPYPPNFPKQEGEPPRVQPSKKVANHWDDHGNRVQG